MEPLSSNHFSPDLQVLDVLNWMEVMFPDEFATIVAEFPQVGGGLIMSGSWFDTKAMGVEEEFGSWLIDAIERELPEVVWWEGEPWHDPFNELAEVL